MKRAEIIKHVDLKYKNGYVECACGWHKDLGDGFNGYHIDVCPACTQQLEVRHQRRVIYNGTDDMQADVGDNVYFALSNGINVRYSNATRTYYGTVSYLERL